MLLLCLDIKVLRQRYNLPIVLKNSGSVLYHGNTISLYLQLSTTYNKEHLSLQVN
jgi:hypothetical protein